MFVLSNFIYALASLISYILTALYWLIAIRALISWVNPDPFNPIVQFLYRVTDPVLNPIRRILPAAPIDISPIIAFLLIMFLRSFLIQTLVDIAARL